MPFTRDVVAAAPILSAAIVRKWGGGDLIRSAFQHGRERRVDGFSEEMLFQEHPLVRQGSGRS